MSVFRREFLLNTSVTKSAPIWQANDFMRKWRPQENFDHRKMSLKFQINIFLQLHCQLFDTKFGGNKRKRDGGHPSYRVW